MDNRGEEDLREIAQLLAEKKNRADFDALQEQIREEEVGTRSRCAVLNLLCVRDEKGGRLDGRSERKRNASG